MRIPEIQQVELVSFCRKAGHVETGGILLGKYIEADSCALVTSVTGPPPDSRRTKFTFQRGVKGLQRLLDRLWNKNEAYYLGEWHFHPAPVPNGSPQDYRQMQRIAASQDYGCPEPLLVIVSLLDNTTEFRLTASVHRSKLQPITLS
ncbi:Mov34/MPN/PAD-1 family protein [Novipirellula rosea]|uniref:Mov34/MPN/PAD-1 family protein n=1 Tax=Novipirellula rosea TaxID=1031540 RepID=UPI003CD0A561